MGKSVRLIVREIGVQSKLKKMVLDISLLNTQYYKVRIKGKWSNPGNGEVLSPTHV